MVLILLLIRQQMNVSTKTMSKNCWLTHLEAKIASNILVFLDSGDSSSRVIKVPAGFKQGMLTHTDGIIHIDECPFDFSLEQQRPLMQLII